jgi:inorganic phosphate transporter, PiT family
VTTFLGSTMALILAQELLTTFTGKGLVPDSIVILKSFSLAVVLAAAVTVMLATRVGIPISTTPRTDRGIDRCRVAGFSRGRELSETRE